MSAEQEHHFRPWNRYLLARISVGKSIIVRWRRLKPEPLVDDAMGRGAETPRLGGEESPLLEDEACRRGTATPQPGEEDEALGEAPQLAGSDEEALVDEEPGPQRGEEPWPQRGVRVAVGREHLLHTARLGEEGFSEGLNWELCVF